MSRFKRSFNPLAYSKPTPHVEAKVSSKPEPVTNDPVLQEAMPNPVQQEDSTAAVVDGSLQNRPSTPDLKQNGLEQDENLVLSSASLLASKFANQSVEVAQGQSRPQIKKWNCSLGKLPSEPKADEVTASSDLPHIRSFSSPGNPNIDTPLQNSTNETATTTNRTLDISQSSCSSASEGLANGVIVTDTISQPSHEAPKVKMTTTSRSPSQIDHPPIPHVKPIQQDLTHEEMLRQARSESIKQVRLRIRAKEKDSTTSLRDLDLARKQVTDVGAPDTFNVPAKVVKARSINKTPDKFNASADGIRMMADKSGSNVNLATNATVATQPQSSQSSKKSHKKLKRNVSQDEHQAAQDVIDSPRASRADLKPVDMESNSDACFSPAISNVTQATNDSLQKLHAGKPIHADDSSVAHPLAGWDGSIQPPPVDWNDRPGFDHSSHEFQNDFARWNHDVCQMMIGESESLFSPIPHHVVLDTDKHADGISMVPRDTIINHRNAHYYGYSKKNAVEIIKYVQPIVPADFEALAKLDMNRRENVAIKDETTETLVSNWKRHKEEQLKLTQSQNQRGVQAIEASSEYKAASNLYKPKINIYLRPASQVDASQMTEIYNWYIEHTVRPVETRNIEEDNMLERLDIVQSAKLPFIVAVDRMSHTAISYDLDPEDQARRKSPHSIKNFDSIHKSMTVKEKVIGWACAQDFSAADYVEHISAELEVYVDPKYRRLGVGGCLMDALLEACDRGYLKRNGYPFHCPPEIRHLYSTGGGRNLHKLIFVVRKLRHPQSNSIRGMSTAHKHVSINTAANLDDSENDYDVWLKKWLESWKFEVEGVLKGVGAKGGRFLDLVHFGRETNWQPNEGRIPEPYPGF